MQYLTYADLLRPEVKKNALLYDLILVFAGSLFIAVSAQISFYLPFSVIPVTGQTFAVLLNHLAGIIQRCCIQVKIQLHPIFLKDAPGLIECDLLIISLPTDMAEHYRLRGFLALFSGLT